MRSVPCAAAGITVRINAASSVRPRAAPDPGSAQEKSTDTAMGATGVVWGCHRKSVNVGGVSARHREGGCPPIMGRI